MDDVLEQHEVLVRKANLAKTIKDIQKLIDKLSEDRKTIAAGRPPQIRPTNSMLLYYFKLANAVFVDPKSASITLAKLQNAISTPVDAIAEDLRQVYNGLSKYTKVLDKVWEFLGVMVATLC